MHLVRAANLAATYLQKRVTMPTYTAPGVYVEEVVSTQKVLSAAPDRGRRVRRLHRARPDRRPDRPARAWPRGWSPAGPSSRTSTAASPRAAMLPLSVYGYFANGGALAYIVPGARTPRRPASPSAPRTAGRRPRARSAASRSRASSRDADITDRRSSTEDTGEDGPRARSTFDAARPGARRGRRVLPGPRPWAGRRATSPPWSTRPRPRSRSTCCSTTKTDLSSQLEVLKPGVYPLEKADARHRCPSPAASSPAPSRPAPASTASPSPTTSRW